MIPEAMADQYDQLEPSDEKHKQQTAIEHDDLRRLMSSGWGRRLMWRLLSEAGVFRLSYTGEAQSTAFNEGRRSYGLAQLNMINEVCPEIYVTMLQENATHASA